MLFFHSRILAEPGRFQARAIPWGLRKGRFRTFLGRSQRYVAWPASFGVQLLT
jgi:hypothetical protein